MLEFGSPYTPNRLFIPPIQTSKFIYPTAIVRTLATVFPVFMAGVPGSVITPEAGVIAKQAGSAYTLGASTTFNMRYETSNVNVFSNYTTTGFFDTAALSVMFIDYQLSTFIAPSDNMIGQGLKLQILGGDLTGGDGDLIIWLQYRIWPFGTNLS